MADEECCPLCGRILGTVNIDRHHLIPKSLKGKEQFLIHKICHRKIHSAFTERELLHSLHTWEDLQANEEIQAFIAWVRKKDPGYYSGSTSTNRKRRK
jgi:5-methylcytosine-specific restriction endonuclease McrA